MALSFKMERKRAIVIGVIGLLALMSVCGCREQVDTMPQTATGVSKAGPLMQPSASAGVKLDPALAMSGQETVQQIAARRSWASRSDPFALLSSEAAFNQSQTLERIVASGGGYQTLFVEPEINYEVDRPTVQQSPPWRVAGIAITEGAVMALLDLGTSVELVRPGSQVPGTEWVCVSIDSERAVFRRSGNALPKEITVPLGGRLDGGAGIGGGGVPGTGGGGRPDGGRPGGARGGAIGGEDDK